MAGATHLVRQALDVLGADAPDAHVRAFLQEKAPSVPGSYVALALRKIRGRVIPVRSMPDGTSTGEPRPGPDPEDT